MWSIDPAARAHDQAAAAGVTNWRITGHALWQAAASSKMRNHDRGQKQIINQDWQRRRGPAGGGLGPGGGGLGGGACRAAVLVPQLSGTLEHQNEGGRGSSGHQAAKLWTGWGPARPQRAQAAACGQGAKVWPCE